MNYSKTAQKCANYIEKFLFWIVSEVPNYRLTCTMLSGKYWVAINKELNQTLWGIIYGV